MRAEGRGSDNPKTLFSQHFAKSLHGQKYVVFTSSIHNYVLIFPFGNTVMHLVDGLNVN